MKKVFYGIYVALGTVLFSISVYAVEKYEDLLPKQDKKVIFTGFYNYPPFGSVEFPDKKIYGDFSSILLPTIAKFAKENKINLEYDMVVGNYEATIQKVRRGEIDLVFGMYHETSIYKGIEYVYPAAVSNPVTIIMMPDRINEIKTLKDLENLKGAISNDELFSDYVSEQINRFKLQKEKTPYELFEKLFVGEVDYVMGSQYYLLIEAAKLGISEQIGVANQTLWNMPLFFGVSKLSQWRKFLIYKLSRLMADKQIQQQIRDELFAEIKKIQEKNLGVVPPAYVKKQTSNDIPASMQDNNLETE